jgi:uncharacterized protein
VADITNSIEEMRALLGQPRRIAMVGASDKPERDSNSVFAVLLEAGHDVIPVNPTIKEVHGVPAVPDLKAAAAHWDEPIEIVDVFRSADKVMPVVDEAIAVGAQALWFQFGVVNEEANRKAVAAGLDIVVDRCIKIEQRRLVH